MSGLIGGIQQPKKTGGFFKNLLGGIASGITGNPLGLALNIGSTILGNKSRKSAEQRSFERQKDLFDYMNKYNTPAKQMERLREAGLNPALMYGQGTTGNASSMPTANMGARTDMGDIANLQQAGVGMATQDSVISANISRGIQSLQEARSKGLDGGTEMYQNQVQLLNMQADDLQSQIALRDANKLNVDALRRINEQIESHQGKTGTIKGDIMGNLMRAWDINLNTQEGREKLKSKVQLLFGAQLFKDLFPSLLNFLGNRLPGGKTNYTEKYDAEGILKEFIINQKK